MAKPLQETSLKDDKNRFVIFPVKHHDIWDWYKKIESRSWTVHTDIADHKLEIKEQKLSTNEVYFLRVLLAFLAGSQELITRNITRELKLHNKIPEASFCFDIQAVSENVHLESFSLLTRSFLNRPKTEERVLAEINPQLRLIETRIRNWTREDSMAENLVTSAALNAIYFPAALSAFLWLRKRKDLSHLNYYCDLISRDKVYHRDLAIDLFLEKIKKDISEEKVRNIITETNRLIGDFLMESLPVNLIGMPVEHMRQYLNLLTDSLFEKLDCPKDSKPTQNLRTSLAEQRAGAFQQAGRKNIDKDSDKISSKTDL